MKVKILCRNPQDYLRQTKSDVHKIPRNLDPALHPLENQREYVRALNATKLDRVFAKPFLGNLSGHTDGVYCMAKHPTKLSMILSGSCDGEVKLWDLSRQESVYSIPAHSGFVRGVCMNHEGSRFVTVGEDKIVRQWDYPDFSTDSPRLPPNEIEPLSSVISKSVFLNVDHHYSQPYFATCGEQVEIWDETRSDPLQSFTWGVDSITNVRYNPIEQNVIVSTGSDRAITLYDVRKSTPIRKVVLAMKSNGISWNPVEAFVFTAANEDTNLYSFDMRYLDRPSKIHIDHVMAVLDVDYSPTGTEFVSGSYDKTVRIFESRSGRSKEVYHTKRMQRIFCVKWSSDNSYVLSGSDETNIRLWKAEASKKIGKLRGRERASLNYAAKLRHQYRWHPVVRRIARHRHVPRMIYSLRKEKHMRMTKMKRKSQNKT